MKLLSFDTAMAACSVAVIDTAHTLPLAALSQPMERGHAEALAPMIARAMAEAGLAFAALDRIIVTRGPGTFTGVRVGLAMARGLGLALGRPVQGLDTLAAIAANVSEDDAAVLVVSDARKAEVYAALFAPGGAVLSPPAVMPLSAAAGLAPEGATVIGTAADQLIAQAARGDLRRSGEGDLPAAANFGRAASRLAAPAAVPSPLYLRSPDARPQADMRRRVAVISCIGVTAAHAGLLAQLHGECFDNGWSKQDFESLLATPGTVAVLAMDGEEPVGFLLLRRAADEAEIITIGTRPFAQRRGAARTLMAHAAEHLATAGVAKLHLEVAASNAAARGLYGGTGFVQSGTRKAYYAVGPGRHEDAVVMVRNLQP